ncbi:hypothetical protein [Aliikangiella sp. IMCC44632]
MKPVERSKIQKLITKIENECFDENDIDSLFMKLRAYSSGYSIFREVSDFVAHNDLRNRGIANQSLETMYLRMKFFVEYNSPKKTLDLSQTFPIWIKKLMKLQVEKCKEDDLKLKFNVTKKRLVNRIEAGFKEDKKNKAALYKQGKLSLETFNAIQHVLSFISGQEAFSQDEVINELISVLVKNKVEFNEERFRALSDKITVCILLLFHHAEFDFKGYKPGKCRISSEKESISHNVQYVDANGEKVEHVESFGSLNVSGLITLRKDDKDLSIGHSVMSTNLDAEEWCSTELFHIEPFNNDLPKHMCKRLKLDVELCLRDDFKLSSSAA